MSTRAPIPAATLAAVCLVSSAFAADQTPSACPQGATVQWIADYCMARIGTDDEIAASDCIGEQSRIQFASPCAAKRHFKRALCEMTVRRGAYGGSVEDCSNDPGFSGPTVKHDGVGARNGAPANEHALLRPARRELSSCDRRFPWHDCSPL